MSHNAIAKEDVLTPEVEPDAGTLADAASAGMPVQVRAALAIALIVLSLISAFPLRAHFSSPDAYASTIATLDEKKANVLGLVAASTAASASITLIPDDVGTPLADKLMDLSSNFMMVLAVIYLEKYLLTIFGLVSFGLLLPAACLGFAVALLTYTRFTFSWSLVRIGKKLIILGAVLMLTVPSSVLVTDMIDQTYDASQSVKVEAPAEGDTAQDDADEEGTPLDFILGIPDAIASGVSSITGEMLDQVNRLIEGAAVMIVTSCLIPILVLLFFLWAANLLLGVDTSGAQQFMGARMRRLGVRREDLVRAKRDASPR